MVGMDGSTNMVSILKMSLKVGDIDIEKRREGDIIVHKRR